MKQVMTKVLRVLAVTVMITGGTAYAQTPVSDTQNREAPAKTTGMPMGDSKMGSMKMDDMQGMMRQCMEMHKDGKMCDHQAMEKCEENMKKGECQKMMKQAKKNEKAKK